MSDTSKISMDKVVALRDALAANADVAEKFRAVFPGLAAQLLDGELDESVLEFAAGVSGTAVAVASTSGPGSGAAVPPRPIRR